MRYFLSVTGILLSSVLLAGCATKSTPQEPQPQPVVPLPCSCHPPIRQADPALVVDPGSVYFDYDSFIVKNEYWPLLDRQERYLTSVAPESIQVVGNADERGGAEYNLALGQKRAEAVKKVLITLGAKEAQIEAISFGKERPVALGHDEAAWTKNRRVDFVAPTAKK